MPKEILTMSQLKSKFKMITSQKIAKNAMKTPIFILFIFAIIAKQMEFILTAIKSFSYKKQIRNGFAKNAKKQRTPKKRKSCPNQNRMQKANNHQFAQMGMIKQLSKAKNICSSLKKTKSDDPIYVFLIFLITVQSHQYRGRIMLMDASQSEEQATRRTEIQIQHILMKALKSADCILQKDISENIRIKIEEAIQSEEHLGSALEYFIYTLLGQVEQFKQSASICIEKQDYEVLENAVQKSEAEVRKHIRIQQQLKIYMDGLQEKVETLQKQLKIEEKKYMQIFESMKAIDLQRKDLLKKLNKLEYQMNRQTSKGNEPLEKNQHKQMFVARDKGKTDGSGSKSRYMIDKLTNERSKKIVKQKQTKNGRLKFLQGSIYVNLNANNLKEQSKRNSKDHCSSQIHSKQSELHDKLAYEQSIKELTKTVQMNHLEKRRVRRISKYRTQAGEQEKKDGRSNSVCQ